MRLITITNEETGAEVQRVVTADEMETLNGVQLAALLFPAPGPEDVKTVNTLLERYRSGEMS